MSEWVTDLNSTDDKVQMLAQQAVAELGPQAVPYLEKDITVTGLGRHPQFNQWVTDASRHLPATLGKAIRRRWGSPGSWMAGSGAAAALAEMKEDARSAVPALLAALDDTNANVRSHAACALIQIAPDDFQMMSVLFHKVANDSEGWVFSNLSNHFLDLQTTDGRTAGLMLENFAKANQQAQFNILRALGRFTPLSKEAGELLRKSMAGTNRVLKAGAAIGLTKAGETNSAAITGLIQGASSGDLMAKYTSIQRLSELGKSAPEAEPVMLTALADRMLMVKAHAMNYLYRLNHYTNTMPPLLSGNLQGGGTRLQQEQELQAFVMVERIHIKDWSELKAVTGCLQAQDAGIRRAAVRAYARFAKDDISLSLVELEMCLRDESLAVQVEAAKALATLKPDSAKLHGVLKGWLGEGGYTSRLEAVKLIQTRPEFVERYRTELQTLTKEKGERLRKAVEETLEMLKK